MRKKVDELYICAKDYNDELIATKIVALFSNGEYYHLSLSDGFDLLNDETKKKEINKLERKIIYFSNLLKKQGDFNEEHILVFKEGSKYEKKLDKLIDKIPNLNKDILLSKEENISIAKSLAFTFCLGLSSALAHYNTLPSLYCLILANLNLKDSIKNNKKRSKLKNEKMIYKKLKLYFSYFMMIFNLGLSLSEIKYDKEENKIEISFDKIELYKDSINEFTQSCIQAVLSDDLDNPFQNENIELLDNEKVEMLMEELDRNPVISNKDYEIACSLEEFILENPYFDYQEAYDKFSTLRIINSNLDNGRIAASYNENKNLITVYKTNKKTFDNYSANLEHEFLHSIRPTLDNIVLEEGMTSLLQAEYFNNGILECSYYDHVRITKIFCELITPEKMLEAYSKGDMTIIETEMLKIHNNKEDYEKLLSTMQEFGKKFYDENTSIYLEEYQNILSETEKLYEIFENLLKPYIESSSLSSEQRRNCYINLYKLGSSFWNEDTFVDKLYYNIDNDNKIYKKKMD